MANAPDLEELAALYRDLHAHPELAFAEHRTAGIAADRLRDLGYQVTTGVGGTGVVGVLANGDGPTVLLRADMDGLPVLEQTGLPYASTGERDDSRARKSRSCTPAATTCTSPACSAPRRSWPRPATPGAGTLLLVFQPAEEAGKGALAMIGDGLFERFPVPGIVLGQHVMPLPAGVLAIHGGAAMAAGDAVRIVLHGQGGHGSRPETTVDPILMAAATVLRLQGVVSGRSRPARARFSRSARCARAPRRTSSPTRPSCCSRCARSAKRCTTRPARRSTASSAAEAAASGAPKEPEIITEVSFPVLVNDKDASARLTELFNARVRLTLDPGPVTGSEDVGLLATAAGVPCAYWFLGGSDPALFAGVATMEEARGIVDGLPSNHSPLFAPVIDPTIRTGMAALTTAARAWLAPAGDYPLAGAASGA